MTAERKKTVRGMAVDILDRIDRDRAYAEPLLDAVLTGTEIPNLPDRKLLTELVYGTLRMRGRLDWIIGRLYRGKESTLETTPRNILRTALYQLLFTDRIPAFAAVNEAVGIARQRCPAAAGLVNAILRNAIRNQENMTWPEMAKDPGRALSVLYSHPRWLVERWLDRYGIGETISISRANNDVPPMTVRVNSLKISREKIVTELSTNGIMAERTRFSPDGLHLLTAGADLRRTGFFRDGLIRIQDEASQLVSRVVAPRPGERILDICSGTGGKTLHLAAIMENRGHITAMDLHPDKLLLLSEEAYRLGVTISEILPGDATAMPEPFRAAFDRVLVDAPCSGLGTLRRNPEIRWRIVPSDIENAMALQKRLLANAAETVKPGGLLVYCVCTVTQEENESVVDHLLAARHDFKHIPPEGVPPELVDARGFFRTCPHREGMDGFFAAAFRRTS